MGWPAVSRNPKFGLYDTVGELILNIIPIVDGLAGLLIIPL